MFAHGVHLNVGGELDVHHPRREASRVGQVRNDAQGDDRGGETDGQDTGEQPRRFDLQPAGASAEAELRDVCKRRIWEVAFASGKFACRLLNENIIVTINKNGECLTLLF